MDNFPVLTPAASESQAMPASEAAGVMRGVQAKTKKAQAEKDSKV